MPAYLRERFLLRVFGFAALGLTAAALWASSAAPTPAVLVYSTLLSVLLLLQFRLWDDLEDRAADSKTHPDRVLVRTEPGPYRRALTYIALANVALSAVGGWPAVIAIVLLDLVFFIAYRRARRHVSDGVWRFSILLLKYPAFVVIVATVAGAPEAGRLARAALIAYSAACLYEALHGRRHLAGVPS